MRKLLVAVMVVVAVGFGVRVAEALSEWWSPVGRPCPTFDTEEACESACQADQKLCGGATQCEWHSDPQGDKPMC
jgi:hypothetical protein